MLDSLSPFVGIYVMAFILLTRSQKAWLWILLAVLVLAFVRDATVGSDYKGYMKLISTGYYDITFDDATQWYGKNNLEDNTYGTGALREFGFSIIVTFISTIFSPANTVFVIILLTFSLYVVALRRTFGSWSEINLPMFILLSMFILYAPFNTLRQSFSMSVFTLGVTYLLDRRIAICAILFLLAATIHTTAIIIIVLTLLTIWLKLSPKICMYILIGVSCVYLADLDLSKLVEIMPSEQFGRNLTLGYNEKFKMMSEITFWMKFVLIVMQVGLFCWFYSYADGDSQPYYMLWFMGLIIYILFIPSPNVARISEFLYPLMAFAVPITLRDREDVPFKAYYYLLLFCSIFYIVYAVLNWYGLRPFKVIPGII